MDDRDVARARICPPCTGDCRQGRDCPAEVGEPVAAWPFMLASGVGSLLLVLLGYALGTWFAGSGK